MEIYSLPLTTNADPATALMYALDMRGNGMLTADADQILYGAVPRGGISSEVRFRFDRLADAIKEAEGLLWIDQLEVPDEHFALTEDYIALVEDGGIPDDQRAEQVISKIYGQLTGDNLVDYIDLPEHQRYGVVDQAMRLAATDYLHRPQRVGELLEVYVYGQLRSREEGIGKDYSDRLFELGQQLRPRRLPSLIVPSDQWMAGTAAKHYQHDVWRASLCGRSATFQDRNWTHLSTVIKGELQTQATCKQCLSMAQKRGDEVAYRDMEADEHYDYLLQQLEPAKMISIIREHEDQSPGQLREAIDQAVWEQMVDGMIWDTDLSSAQKDKLKQLRPGDRVPKL